MAQPEKVFKQGCCSAAIFVNRIKKNGIDKEIKSVALQKRYKDRDGNILIDFWRLEWLKVSVIVVQSLL